MFLTINFSRLALCSALSMVLLCVPSAGAQTQGATKSIQAGGDQTLVIPPSAPPPAQPNAKAPRVPEQSTPEQNAPEPDIGSDNAPLPADLPIPENNGPRPYLGITVLYTVSTRDGQQVGGLEVMDVDADSPASRAGLKARTPMSEIGASGATVGELLGPLDAAMRPLLAKTGQLGEDGDLIVAIDDHRVTSDSDLPDHLARLHPGDIIYLTVLRQQRGGSYKAVKLPVTLGFQKSATR
ncbi:MAG TPA: PDZ domain-containing protein [Candidatus Binataceae bacterium]|nr:PDZ domain-containing protein [Candidatus Binataceae bacterium]